MGLLKKTPTGICGAQIFGNDPIVMAQSIESVMKVNPQIIDINMGCPAPKISGNGGGASLAKNPQLAEQIVKEVVKAAPVPVTVKIRAGWDENSINAVEMAQRAENAGASAITIHGRTKKQMYAPPVDRNIIAEVKKLLGKTPVFGIGLGHQLVALALGGETAKQKYGHRGGNQPVKCQKCNRVYISSQNHGYEVVKDSLQTGTVKFVNVNDGSCEGIDYDEINAFTVQFNPECCDLGNTENPLYKKFFALMKKEKDNA